MHLLLLQPQPISSSSSLIIHDPLLLSPRLICSPRKELADDDDQIGFKLPFAPATTGTTTSADDIAGDGERRLEWLRSQIIGAGAEFQSPFGRRRITYCDLTASGRFLQVIEDYVRNRVLPFYGNTHTGDSYVGFRTTQLVHRACLYVKQCLGGGRRDILLFCGSGCTAAVKRLQEVMGIAVSPILRSQILASCIRDSERWVVFVGPYEHHSNLLTWRQSLTQVVEIGLHDATGQIDVEELESALSAPEFAGRPKLGSFSACSNVTGIRTDTRAIARLLHRYGAYACFDFACSGPYVDVDIRSTTRVGGDDDDYRADDDRYDAVFLSPHKFLGGPGSPGILLMSEELYRLKNTPPSTSGGGTVRFVNGYKDEDTLYSEDPEEREDAGTPAIVQKIRAALAFRVKELLLADGLMQRREEELTAKVLARLSANPKIHVLGLNDDANSHHQTIPRLPIVSFLIYPTAERRLDQKALQKLPHLHCRFVTKLLNDLFGIQARGGCACAGPYSHYLLKITPERSRAIRTAIMEGYEGVRPGFTRVSFAYYATDQETDFVLNAIEFVAEYGHRFLPFYAFDWSTGDWNCRRNFDTTSSSEADVYEEYLGTATRSAQSLPPKTNQRTLPPGVDPDLLTFMI